MTRTYPPLDVATLRNLRIVQRFLAEDPAFLTHEDSPYSSEIVQWFGRAVPEKPVMDVPEMGDLDTEMRGLFKQLKSLQNSVTSDTSQKEQIELIKAATALMGKIVDIQEKAAHIANVEEFRRTIMAILADVLSPEQRTQFMDRLTEHGNF